VKTQEGVWMFYSRLGMVRVLSLNKAIAWTPLLVYLINQLRLERLEPYSVYWIYVLIVTASDGISLIFDYIDLVRFFFLRHNKEIVTMDDKSIN
jgi:hypothetical protein